MPRLVDAPAPVRLAVGCFAALVLGFVLLAQVNLWHQVGGGAPPGPDTVLHRYHGNPDITRLHDVLDLSKGLDDGRNMWQYLGGQSRDDPTTLANRTSILDWVDAGAPEAGWATVQPIFTGFETCGGCHAPGGAKKDKPFTTYEQVLPFTKPGGGAPLGPLLISAHTHLFGFAVLAFLLSLGLCATRIVGRPRALLILAASAGAALDISGWFLTRSWGRPFHFQVMLGGGLFGLACTLMALAMLRDCVLAGAAARAPADDATP